MDEPPLNELPLDEPPLDELPLPFADLNYESSLLKLKQENEGFKSSKEIKSLKKPLYWVRFIDILQYEVSNSLRMRIICTLYGNRGIGSKLCSSFRQY